MKKRMMSLALAAVTVFCMGTPVSARGELSAGKAENKEEFDAAFLEHYFNKVSHVAGPGKISQIDGWQAQNDILSQYAEYKNESDNIFYSYIPEKEIEAQIDADLRKEFSYSYYDDGYGETLEKDMQPEYKRQYEELLKDRDNYEVCGELKKELLESLKENRFKQENAYRERTIKLEEQYGLYAAVSEEQRGEIKEQIGNELKGEFGFGYGEAEHNAFLEYLSNEYFKQVQELYGDENNYANVRKELKPDAVAKANKLVSDKFRLEEFFERLKELDKQYFHFPESCQNFLFSLSGIERGKCTVKVDYLKSFDYKDGTNYALPADDYEPHEIDTSLLYAVVEQWNGEAGRWESMKKLAKVSEEGMLTIEFDRYDKESLIALQLVEYRGNRFLKEVIQLDLTSAGNQVSEGKQEESAQADKPSGSVPATQDEKANELDKLTNALSSGNVTIGAAGGRISAITEAGTKALIYDRVSGSDWKNEILKKADFVIGAGNHTFEKHIYFDVQGVKGGQVTLKIAGDAAELAGSYAVASHYNMLTKQWETMEKIAKIDQNGYVTIEFSSYSPVILSVFRAMDESKISAKTVAAATMKPNQTLPETSPKTGESNNAVLAYMVLLLSSCGTVMALRKKIK